MSHCFVYLMAMTLPDGQGPIKVGIAQNPRRRWQSISGYSPFPVRLVNYWRFDDRDTARFIETQLHAELGETALRHEWFAMNHREAHGIILARMGDGVLSAA
jgi:hypothetical protein